MTRFSIRLAGFVIDVCAVFDTTEDFCRDYLFGGTPDLSVTVTQSDIDAERERSAAEDKLEGIPIRSFSDRYLETLALYRKIVTELIDRDVVLFHGCAVALDGKAYIFTARSGTGKTTHAGLWLKNIKGSYILNGDKPLLRFDGDKILVCGTPWTGKEKFGINEILPLEAVCILTRSETNTIRRITPDTAFNVLINQSHRPEDTDKFLKTVFLIRKLMHHVGLYQLGCNMEDEAAWVSYRGIVKNECNGDTSYPSGDGTVSERE